MTPQHGTGRIPEQDRRIPSLDGIRAVLIVVVLSVHTLGTKNFPLSRDALPLESVAYLAMRVFFIISGFLITGILLNEMQRRGTINLFRFYFKRTFRIFPAYYAFLIVLAAVSWLGAIEFRPGDLIHAFTYTSNYNPDRAWYLGHTWSLSVEEQFYMLWPAVLLLIGVRRASWALVGLVALIPLWRIALLALPEGAFGLGLFQAGISHTFDTTADIIAAGCLLAIFRSRLWQIAAYRRFLESRYVFVLLMVAILIPFIPELVIDANRNVRYAVLGAVELVGLPIVNISVAILIDWAMRNPHGSTGRVLNHPWAMKLGLMSYSIYLWQQVFLNRHEQNLITTFPLNVILAVVLGWLSYRLVEMPMMKMRDRLDSKRRPAPVPRHEIEPAAQPQPVFAGEVRPVSGV